MFDIIGASTATYKAQSNDVHEAELRFCLLVLLMFCCGIHYCSALPAQLVSTMGPPVWSRVDVAA